MKDKLRFPVLEEIGFSLNEARIYELLLVDGIQKVQDLAKKSGISRGNVYNTLTQLKAKGFVLPIEGKVERFQAADPARLSVMVDSRKEAAQALEGRFRTELQNLTSAFTLSTGKPAIQIFEGLEGFKTALHDSLSSKTEILTYFDIHALTGDIASVNAAYVKKRVAAGIKKRLIVVDIPEARTFFSSFDPTYTSVAFVQKFPSTFNTALEIYDGTLSFLTMIPNQQISILIKDKNMYELEYKKFEFIWNTAKDIIGYAVRRPAERARGNTSNAA